MSSCEELQCYMDFLEGVELMHLFDENTEAEVNGSENVNETLFNCMLNIIELEYILNVDDEPCKARVRRWGVHPINQLRKEHGHFENLVAEMIAYDHDKFFNFTRMTPQRFEYLLSLIRNEITKTSSNAIPATCRLLLTLRYVCSELLCIV